jgi:RNA polymerase sigma-70 factor (ECF subfamily)
MIQHSTSVGAQPQYGPVTGAPAPDRSGPNRQPQGQRGPDLDSWKPGPAPSLARIFALPIRQPGPATAARFATDLCAAVTDLRRIARRLVNQECLADDLVQLTCMRALERRDQFQMGTNLVGWLSTILRNLHRDELRRRRYQASLESQLGELTGDDQGRDETPLWSNLSAEDVRLACNALPEEMRAAYLLYTFEGLTYVAIAGKLGVPMATVATRLYRARIKLREILIARLGLPRRRASENASESSCSS